MNQTFVDKLADKTVSGLKGFFTQSINAGEDPTACMQMLSGFLQTHKDKNPQFFRKIAARIDSSFFAPLKKASQVASPDGFIATYHHLLSKLLEIDPEMPYRADYDRQEALIDSAKDQVRESILAEKDEKKRIVDDQYSAIVSQRKEHYRKIGGGKSHRKRVVVSVVISICLLVPLLMNAFIPPSAAKDKVLERLPRPALHTTSVQFSTDRVKAASPALFEHLWGDIIIWDVITEQSVMTLTGHEQPPQETTFSSDGRRLASVDPDGTVIVWDLATGEAEESFEVNRRIMNLPLFFSSDSTRLAVVIDDGIVISDVERKDETLTITKTFWTWSASLSPDGTKLASGTDDIVTIWDLKTGEPAKMLAGETGSAIRSTAFSPDGTRLAVGAADGTLSIWDLAADKVEKSITLGRTPRYLCFSPNGTKLIAALASNLIAWDLTTSETIPLRSGTNAAVQSMVAFSPDGTRLASIHGLSEIIIWDMARTEPFIPFLPRQLLYVVLLFGAIAIISAIAYGSRHQAIGLTPEETAAYKTSSANIEDHFSDKEQYEITGSTLGILTADSE